MAAEQLEPLITRDELTATHFNIADIRSEVRTIRQLLEESDEEEHG